MTMRSALGKALSRCQTLRGARPAARASASWTSCSRLDPGKMMMAACIGRAEITRPGVAIKPRRAAERPCVLRQAQDEEDRIWHRPVPDSLYLILSLSKDARPHSIESLAL